MMHQRGLWRRLLGGALLLGCVGVAAGCTSFVPEDDPPSVAQKAQSVIGGALSKRESVVLVRAEGPNRTSVCTGTLIAPNLVVTARHCVSAFTDGDFSCTIDGSLDLTRTRTPATAGDMGLPYLPEVIGIHTGTQPDFETPATVARVVFAPETDTICRNDIAFLVLEGELSLPFEALRLESGLTLGEPLTVIGFGLNDNRLVERTERENVLVQAIGPSDFYPVEGNALPRTFVLGTSVCPGDSGGPAYSSETEEVVGVFSFFRGDCESSEARNFFTQIAPYRTIAEEAYAEAGYAELLMDDEPEAPSPEGPGGAAATEEDDRASTSSSSNKKGCSFGPARVDSPGLLMMWLFAILLSARVTRRRGRAAPRFLELTFEQGCFPPKL